jgi:hypothetical protein
VVLRKPVFLFKGLFSCGTLLAPVEKLIIRKKSFILLFWLKIHTQKDKTLLPQL